MRLIFRENRDSKSSFFALKPILHKELWTNTSLNQAEIFNAARSHQDMLEKKISDLYPFSVPKYEGSKLAKIVIFAFNSESIKSQGLNQWS